MADHVTEVTCVGKGNNPPVLFRRLLRRRLVGMSVSMSISREMHFVRYGKEMTFNVPF